MTEKIKLGVRQKWLEDFLDENIINNEISSNFLKIHLVAVTPHDYTKEEYIEFVSRLEGKIVVTLKNILWESKILQLEKVNQLQL